MAQVRRAYRVGRAQGTASLFSLLRSLEQSNIESGDHRQGCVTKRASACPMKGKREDQDSPKAIGCTTGTDCSGSSVKEERDHRKITLNRKSPKRKFPHKMKGENKVMPFVSKTEALGSVSYDVPSGHHKGASPRGKSLLFFIWGCGPTVVTHSQMTT